MNAQLLSCVLCSPPGPSPEGRRPWDRERTLQTQHHSNFCPSPTRSLQSHFSVSLTGNNPFLNSLNRVQETQHDSKSRFPLVEKVRVSAVFWSALRCPPPKGELRMAPNKRAWTSGARVPHPHPVSAPQSLRSSMHELGDQPTIVPRQSWHLLQRFALQQKASKPERSIINRWLYAHPSEQTHSLGSSLKLGSPLKNKTCKRKKKGKLRYHPRILGEQ